MQKRAAQKHLRVWQSGGALSSVPPHSEVPGSHCQALHSTDTGQESLSLRGWQAGWQAGEPPRSPRRPSAVPTLACQEAGSCAAGGRAQAESWAGGCAQHIWKCLQCASSRSRRHTRTHTHAHTLARPQPAVHAPLPGGFPRGSLQMRPGHATSEAAAPGGAGPGARGRDTGHRTPAPPAQCSDYLFRRLCMCTVVCTLVRLGSGVQRRLGPRRLPECRRPEEAGAEVSGLGFAPVVPRGEDEPGWQPAPGKGRRDPWAVSAEGRLPHPPPSVSPYF